MHLALVAFALFAAAAPGAPAAPAIPTVSIDLALVEPSRASWGDTKVDAILGSSTTTELRQKNRTVAVTMTVQVAQKADCYRVDLVVHDREIDSTGRFSKKEWQTRGESCGGFSITVGPRDETRVRVAVRRRT